jgi:hypothetical protein
MTTTNGIKNNTDDLKLVREGTSQEQRLPKVLDIRDDAFPLPDEHDIAHRIVFARAYSEYLKFFDCYDLSNSAIKNWQPLFSKDVSVLLSTAAVQDVEFYRSTVNDCFKFLRDINDESDENNLKDTLGFLFSSVGTLAQQLDILKEELPVDNQLKTVLQNQIRNHLAPAFKNLILYYRYGLDPHPGPPPPPPYLNDVAPAFSIMGAACSPFKEIKDREFSVDWITEENITSWPDYISYLDYQDATEIYGSGEYLYERIKCIAMHNHFTSIFDQFLKAYARIVKEAKSALQKSFTEYNHHEPHYALFLSFLNLFEHAREEANKLTQHHLDFYYREVLRLKEKASEPSKAHLLIELAKKVPPHKLKTGELFKAGKDDLGRDVFFAGDRDFVANRAKVASMKTVYWHKNGSVKDNLPEQQHNVFASPVANSDDGMGAELTSPDQSWHPFHNKIYTRGALAEIKMPEAEIGFAIASHYLLLSGGNRIVRVFFAPASDIAWDSNDIAVMLTTEEGWLEKIPEIAYPEGDSPWIPIKNEAGIIMGYEPVFNLKITMDGGDPAVVPYSSEVHGYNFETDLPVLIVKLKHNTDTYYKYSKLKDVVIRQINLNVSVEGLKELAVSNDFGPVDTSKPFQPFGPLPAKNSALIIGSKEVFQKKISSASVKVKWSDTPKPFDNHEVHVNIEFLKAGKWTPSSISAQLIKSDSFDLGNYLNFPVVGSPDLAQNEPYNASSTHSFVRLKLDSDFGQREYEAALIQYIAKMVKNPDDTSNVKPEPPPGPSITELSLNYATETQIIGLDYTDKSEFEKRQSRFFHIAPFGQAEQHRYLKTPPDGVSVLDKSVYLVPQLKHINEFDENKQFGEDVSHEAEFYLGLTDLEPPQNLALFFQVADGTADPLSVKPPHHIHWSYLSGNEWIPFRKEEVEDRTGELVNSGIFTFSVPRYASDDNTLLPSGQHWIRGAVESHTDDVCRLLMVAAQGMETTFEDKGNDPAFLAKVLPPGTISKLDKPDAAVKQVTQPFETFGGRGKEVAPEFYTRISERLRHKDRAIALWDYERLILETFPDVYRVKCLNHTQYEPDEKGAGIYRELGAGHITVVVIPKQEFQKLRDPLRPYASLGLLEEIKTFLRERLSCFVIPHVRNPEFEQVAVSCNVCFKKGADETHSLKEMDSAVIRFLSPWAFPGGGSPSFGGKIRKSTLINFVEDLTYVDYVTDFKLTHTFLDLNNIQVDREEDEVEGSKAVSILVSARKHTGINSIKPV